MFDWMSGIILSKIDFAVSQGALFVKIRRAIYLDKQNIFDLK
jgi:hypothetical protein